MKEIKLTKGQVTIVDDDDYEELSKYKWYFDGFYAVRYEDGKLIFMHRQIVNAPKGLVVDHINRNKLDNRKSNLRLCTHRQNAVNSKHRNNSGYKGVYYDRCLKKYVARIGRKHLGTFATVEEAAKVYDEHAKQLYGEFAYLNFPGYD
jgi:hypothetical protein